MVGEDLGPQHNRIPRNSESFDCLTELSLALSSSVLVEKSNDEVMGYTKGNAVRAKISIQLYVCE